MKSVKSLLLNPYYLSFSGILSLICVQVDSNFRSQREGSLFVFVLETNWYYLLHSYYILHLSGILDSPVACLSSVSITDLL